MGRVQKVWRPPLGGESAQPVEEESEPAAESASVEAAESELEAESAEASESEPVEP